MEGSTRSEPWWKQPLLWRYAIATLTLLALGGYTYFLGERVISSTRGYAALLNSAGRQRMLSQRTVLFLRASADTSGEDAEKLRQQAKQALDEAAAGHTLLTALRAGEASPPYDEIQYGAEATRLFDGDKADKGEHSVGVHALMDAFFLDANGVLRQGEIGSILALRKYTQDRLIPQLDLFVSALQHDAEEVVAHLEHEMLAVSALFALALILQGITVYTPLVRSLRRALKAQTATNEAQKAARIASQESEAYARAIARCTSDAFIVHRDGKIIDWNQNTITMFGYSEDELKNLPPWIIADPSIHEQVRQRVRDQVTVPFEFIGVRKDGTRFHVLSYAQHYAAAGGPVRVTSLRDITLQKETEESQLRAIYAAEQAAQSRLDFLANMSHEIRTPLNGIIGMTDLMMETTLTAEQQHYGGIIRNSSSHLLSIINDILDLSKIESGKMELESARIEITTLVESQAELFLGKAREKGIELRTFVDPQLPIALMGDGGRINQILLNFINNAIKFTEHGSVTVRAALRRIDDLACTVRFSVTDTGIGMDPEVQQRLFTPFSQADASTARRFGGTGLGLSICKQLATLMGGQVGVDSTPGEGSTFWFSLRMQAAEVGTLHDAWLHDQVRGLRVLLVDDDPVVREIVSQYLTAWGMTVEEVKNGTEAIAYAEAHPESTDLALIDLQLPDMDGRTTGAQLRRIWGQRVPQVLITGHSRQASEDALRAGFAALLTKPIRQSQLLDCILDTRLVQVPSRDQAQPVTETAPVLEQAREANHRKRVLVAEDNSVNQLLVLTHLKRLGYTAQAVSNGKEALSALELSPWDLVLMDCQMPEMDGYEAALAIRERETQEHIPIVALTANAMREDRERCLQAGMDDYITKPVNREQLQHALERWLGKNPDLS